MGRLDGKVAFVTGAGGGIGAAICKQFIAEGARVLAGDIHLDLAEAAAEASGGAEQIVPLRLDVTDKESVCAGLARAAEAFGKIDVLCNTAGGSTPHDARVTDAPEEEFWRAIKLDLFGTFLVCKYGIPYLQRAGGGSVINFSSMVALMALTDRDCYTAAKGGVHALTRSMAPEYAHDRIRVNAIAPGLTLSERVRHLVDEREELRKLADQCLLGPCEPVDMAHVAVYLASDESRHTTGQVIPVDSGVTIY
ncbi:SDR family NAD(P)-dependent oxidoreductase [Burkholderia multivorans]|uniref:SDR family NAD(P)-dependent oxidoreductase n=1 Tax=Burkholderia multivorans TaxID=87883 RepID=UPI0019D30D7F|nr:SDR family oxidoreductase [Burkholderia multivorans]MBN6732915.1 SDR family oxidoreductase [Burkholderia multivorans]MBN6738457.1 SDR family oxidoreductase [Burkholderia multivorans]MBN7125156.1 SDR family oxidoreductase [Burkholderia multivorans]MBN8167218.1 SDR family oxidoreductase [Burkholderia multivorans]MBN8173011.1 SDR family oxidoreductase [Burkholderia multivorans]